MTPTERFASKKFFVINLAIILSAVGLFLSKLDGGHFASIITGLGVVYIGGQSWIDRNK